MTIQSIDLIGLLSLVVSLFTLLIQGTGVARLKLAEIGLETAVEAHVIAAVEVVNKLDTTRNLININRLYALLAILGVASTATVPLIELVVLLIIYELLLVALETRLRFDSRLISISNFRFVYTAGLSGRIYLSIFSTVLILLPIGFHGLLRFIF